MSPLSGMPLRNLAASGTSQGNAQAPGLLCRQAIQAAAGRAGIPPQLMAAIARVESGRPDAQGGVHPWPWTINAEGEGHYYASKAEAIAAAQAMQVRGIRSIDVGCMQVNLMFHPEAFASLDQAFDPGANAVYAAHFLNQLYAQTRDWARATANYHSATLDIGADYERRVAMVLPDEQRRMADTPAAPLGGNVWSTNVWSANVWNDRGAAWPVQAGTLGGGYRLSNKADTARIIPARPDSVGRGLAAYRAAPIPIPVAPRPAFVRQAGLRQVADGAAREPGVPR